MNIKLLLLALVSVSIVFVESQRSCSTSDDCKKDECCFDRTCRSDDGIVCELLKTKAQLERCYNDYTCPDGCCVEHKCKPKSSYQCIHKRCHSDLDCDSSCCKNGECQACTNDYSDNYEEDDGRSSSSGSGTRLIIWLTIGIPLKIVFCCICGYCCSRRKRERDVHRRRCGVPRATRVPLITNDELQREHEHAQQKQLQNRRPPPPYSSQDDHHENTTQDDTLLSIATENGNIDPILAAQGGGGADEMNGLPQDAAMVPLHVNHPSPSVNFLPNTTDRHSTDAELIQL